MMIFSTGVREPKGPVQAQNGHRLCEGWTRLRNLLSYFCRELPHCSD
jgi:hypothetical protein